MALQRVAIMVLAAGLILMLFALVVPAIKSRRPVPVGVQDGKLRPCPDSPNCVNSRANAPDHKIRPLVYSGDSAAGIEKLRQVLEQMAGTRVVTCRGDYLHAEVRSRVFGFVDDVEFLASPQEGVIHVRSAARVGYSDMGVNRKRVAQIRSRFEQLDN